MHSNTNLQGGAVTLALATLTASCPLALALAQDWYVDTNHRACGSGTGTQASPFCDVMDAVTAAADGDTIHIAPGTYFENVVLSKSLHLVGTGGEAVTILDGTASGSVVHVQNASVTLTGLTLTNGMSAEGGGGLQAYNGSCGNSEVHLLRCSVTGNTAAWGGGIYVGGMNFGIWCPPGHLTLTDSSVVGNKAVGDYAGGGGIMCGWSSTVLIERSRVSANSCSGPGPRGGGVFNASGAVTIVDSTVTGNSLHGVAGAAGGAVFSWTDPGGSLTIVNSTLSGNSVSASTAYAGGIFVEDAYGGPGLDLELTNSILWGNGPSPLVTAGAPNTSVSHSLVQGGWPGAGNLDADPLFVDPFQGNFRLLPGSPCIDAGDNSAVPVSVLTDIRGFPRFFDDLRTPDTGVGPAPVVDMGAFEHGKRNHIRLR